MTLSKDVRIYVAGHRGLVGSAILESLQEQGYSSLITAGKSDLDLCDQHAVLSFFKQEKPEYVILAAAKVGGIHANRIYPAGFIHDNLAIALNVIHASHAHGVKKLINLGSSCIYPKYAEQPIKETALLTGPLEPTNEAYALAKIAAIGLCNSYHSQYGSNFLSLMPTNLYGSKDNYHVMHSHVIPAIIRKCFLAKFVSEGNVEAIRKDLSVGIPSDWNISSDEQLLACLDSIGIRSHQLTLWGTGKARREFLHAKDCALAVIHFLQYVDANQQDRCYNIGTGDDLEIREIAEIIASIVGFSGTLLFDSSKPDGTPRKVLNVDRAHEMGWSHSISLEDGLKSVIEEYRIKGPEYAR
ncbi:MAG: GDP-L-fucose synthase [Ignavibacteria bacterium]|nr:GDP-L-fucose synthase [Ignavibacteria bacterium]